VVSSERVKFQRLFLKTANWEQKYKKLKYNEEGYRLPVASYQVFDAECPRVLSL